MAHADDRRGNKRPGSDSADRKRPIRASDRARLRGEDGVRRDDYYGIKSKSPRTGEDPVAPVRNEPPPAQAQSPAADSASQPLPSRRERREALARQREHEQSSADSRPGTSNPASATPSTPSAAAATATPTATAHRSRSADRSAAANATSREESRPRHSRREGDAFPSIVRWTTLGTLLPGLGLIRGRRPSGWILLLGFLGAIVLGIGWIIWRSPIKVIARVAGSPTILYTVAIVLLIGILIWTVTILRSYAVLRKGQRMTGAQKWLGWGLVASLILCVGIPLGVGSAYSKVHADAVIKVFGRDGKQGVDIEALWGDTERINVFLIGRDNGDGREGTRPDTMLVASIKPATGDTTLISVPRNLNRAMFPEGSALAERFPLGFDGFGPQESMINAVWTWAEEYPDEVGEVPAALEVGMEATMQAVEGSLGLNLDYYASVDMQGFEDVIDAIGGLKIDVERPIPIGGGTNLNTGMKNPVYGWIDPGEQTLAGSQALWYVRSRDGSDNYDRMCRQQRMIKHTLDQVNPQELAVAYPRLAGSAGRNILTDIPQSEVSAFVELAAAMQGGEIKSAQITNDVTSTTNPDYDLLHAWVQDQINPAEPSQAEDQTADPTESPAPEETEEPTPTGAPAVGIEDAEGKCYPKGYTPGTGWPGWPGNEGA